MAQFIPTWVLVANSARARIFAWTDFQGPLTELEDRANPEGRLKDSELSNDRPGVTYSSKGHQSGHRMQAATVGDAAVDAFARSLVEALKTGLDDQACERLVIVAPPEFLGQLRSHMDRRLERAVAASLDNDLSRDPADAILSRLPRLSNLDAS